MEGADNNAAGQPAVVVQQDAHGLLMRDTMSRFFMDLDLLTPLSEEEVYEAAHVDAYGTSEGYDDAAADDEETRRLRRMRKLRARYLPQIERIIDPDSFWRTVVIDWSDFVDFDDAASLALSKSYVRYESFVNEGLTQALREVHPTSLAAKATSRGRVTLCVAFTKVPSLYTVRTLRAQGVGELCSMSGTVTRTSQVRPELIVGVFKCNDCGTDSNPVEQQFRYTEPPACRNQDCECKNRFTLNGEHKDTRFGDWQKIRVQENANQIPIGCMPRTIEIICRNDAVEVAKPGDRVVLTGFTVAVPEVAKLFNAINRREVQRNLSGVHRAMMEDNQAQNLDGATGLRALGVRDLNYRMCFYATTIADIHGDERKMTHAVKDFADVHESRAGPQLSPYELNKIYDMRTKARGGILKSMARCVAPNIFKHDLVKTGLLLQMLGGVPKTTLEKIQLRGDINACIVGDPSTAKSQFLKWVAHNVQRGIYTSGKASTASGLTATVTRDADTGERTIEAGALMLSDNGVCCIDEFDQMDISDQVAIHEAMEQQTISIAKAGIKATLNARTSLLAALNPLGGKYDRRKPLAKNIAMSAPIMSRFDLMFVVVDEADDEADRTLAESVLQLHRRGELAGSELAFSIEDWTLYMKYARGLTPMMTDEAGSKIVDAYTQMRVQDSLSNRSKVYRVTTRLLESIIRLSEATAKLYLSEVVNGGHVDIALDLMRQSLTTLDMTQVELVAPDEEVKEEPEAPAPTLPGRPERKKSRREESERSQSGPAGTTVAEQQQPQQAPTAKPKKKITITSDQYHTTVNRLITHIHLLRVAPPTAEELMKWYLSEVQTTDLELLQQELHIAQLVLRKLLSEGKVLESADEEDPEGPKRLVVDPNFNPDNTGR